MTGWEEDFRGEGTPLCWRERGFLPPGPPILPQRALFWSMRRFGNFVVQVFSPSPLRRCAAASRFTFFKGATLFYAKKGRAGNEKRAPIPMIDALHGG